MAERPDTAYAHLKVRMKEPLRASLEEAARERGVSMNAEMVARLEQSFAEEARFGGPKMLVIVNQMVGSFLRGGRMAARATKHADWMTFDWLDDPICFRMAAQAVHDDLLAAEPKPDEEVSRRYRTTSEEPKK